MTDHVELSRCIICGAKVPDLCPDEAGLCSFCGHGVTPASVALPVELSRGVVAGGRAFLFCNCGGALMPAVEWLGGSLVELTGIACRQCGTLTPVRAGLIDTREASADCPAAVAHSV